jgi:hypothetical protein
MCLCYISVSPNQDSSNTVAGTCGIFLLSRANEIWWVLACQTPQTNLKYTWHIDHSLIDSPEDHRVVLDGFEDAKCAQAMT